MAERCRALSVELAHYDQSRVNINHCRQFNAWLVQLRSYELLGPRLATLKPARPVARWQVMLLWLAAGFVAYGAFGSRMGQEAAAIVLYTVYFSLLLLFFVPERLYGTTIELLEGKVLRIVDALEQVLVADELGLTEAAYFRVKDNLEQARRELRQQIDLAHRRWR